MERVSGKVKMRAPRSTLHQRRTWRLPRFRHPGRGAVPGSSPQEQDQFDVGKPDTLTGARTQS